jgi:hypothetical protein
MSAREVWRQWYRALRVLRREQRKAAQDLMLFGTGVVMMPNDGDPYHVPLADFRELDIKLP